MYIYHYSKTTGEYLTKSKAEADPAQTKKQGEFVPLDIIAGITSSL